MRERLFAPLGGNATAAFEQFRQRGLYPIFDQKDRPNRFARLSAAASCGQRVDRLELEDMLAWSGVQERHLGFPLLSLAGDVVQAAL